MINNDKYSLLALLLKSLKHLSCSNVYTLGNYPGNKFGLEVIRRSQYVDVPICTNKHN